MSEEKLEPDRQWRFTQWFQKVSVVCHVECCPVASCCFAPCAAALRRRRDAAAATPPWVRLLFSLSF
jgi:hypothetical protein